MTLLYGVALVIARWHDKRVARRASQSPYAGLADDELSPLDTERFDNTEPIDDTDEPATTS